MKLRALIPVRPFEEGKQRLSPRLSPAQRRALNEYFFRHVIGVALNVMHARDCIVVSRSPEALEIADREGIQTLREDAPGGLNAALDQATTHAHAQGADTILAISCDLPLLQPEDLLALLSRAAPRRMVLGTDRTGEGTNALLISPPGAISYRYGTGSHRAHRAASHEAGLDFESFYSRGVASDVDTPIDLAMLRGAIEPVLEFPYAGFSVNRPGN